MTQYGRPISDVTTTNWSPSTGTDLFAVLDEASYDDGDYAVAAANSVATLEVALTSSLNDPGSGTHIVRIRLKVNATNKALAGTWELYQGSTQIFSESISNSTLTTSFAEYTHTLSAGEIAAISDWTDLRIRVSQTSATAGNYLTTSWAELEIPDGTAGPISGDIVATLPALTMASAGTVDVVGDTAVALPALTMASTGVLPIVGTLALTLAALTSSIAGSTIIPLADVVDDFEDGSIGWQWTVDDALGGGLKSGASVVEQNGRVEMSPGDTTAVSYPRLISKCLYDATGSEIVWRMDVSDFAVDPDCSSLLEIKGDDGYQIQWSYSDGVLNVLRRINGSWDNPWYTTYSATDHAWLRIRESSGTIYLDTAPDDGSGNPGSWTNRYNYATSNLVGIESVDIHIVATQDALISGGVGTTYFLAVNTTAATALAGDLAATLPALTSSLAGAVQNDGSLAVTLPSLTSSSAGTVGYDLLENLVDDFEDGTIDSALWSSGDAINGTLVAGASIVEQNGQLEISPGDTTATSYPWVYSNDQFDLVGSEVVVRLDVSDFSTDPDSTALIEARADTGYQLQFAFNNGNLEVNTRISGSWSNPWYTTYSATNHAWLRIRESGGTIYCDTAPDDGSGNPGSWTNRYNYATSNLVGADSIEFRMMCIQTALISGGVGTAYFLAVNTTAAAAEITGGLTADLPALTLAFAGALLVDGDAALTLPALTASIAGTVDIDGDLGVTLPALLASGTGVVTSGIIGTSAIVLPALAVSADGAVLVEGVTDLTLPTLGLAAVGEVLAVGSTALTLPTLTFASAGEALVAGDATIVLPALTASAAATVDIDGTATLVLPMLTATLSSSSVAVGTADITLPALTVSTAGVVQVSGDTALTLPTLSLSANGNTPVAGAGNVLLPALTGTFAGTAPIAGDIGVALPVLTFAATGASTGGAEAFGQLAVTLPALTITSAGVLPEVGTADLVLPALGATLSGAVLVAGSTTLVLPALTAHLSSETAIQGSFDITLPALVSSASGIGTYRGNIVIALPALTIDAAGYTTTRGDLVAVLPALTADFGARQRIGVVLPALVASAAGTVYIEGTASLSLPMLTLESTVKTRVLTIPRSSMAAYQKALRKVQKHGTAVDFIKIYEGTYDPETGEWTSGPTSITISGYAVEIPREESQYEGVELIPDVYVILLFVPTNIGDLPELDMNVSWSGKKLTVGGVMPYRPAGTAIAAEVLLK